MCQVCRYKKLDRKSLGKSKGALIGLVTKYQAEGVLMGQVIKHQAGEALVSQGTKH